LPQGVFTPGFFLRAELGRGDRDGFDILRQFDFRLKYLPVKPFQLGQVDLEQILDEFCTPRQIQVFPTVQNVVLLMVAEAIE
jgi:hypothetical protein